MKFLYALLIVAFMILLTSGGLCLYTVHTIPNQRGSSSVFFSMISMAVEIFAILVGLLGIRLTAKISMTITLTSLLMFVWSYAMYNSPYHISVDEVFLFWIIYALGIIFLSVLGFRAKPKEKEEDWDEDILDDLL